MFKIGTYPVKKQPGLTAHVVAEVVKTNDHKLLCGFILSAEGDFAIPMLWHLDGRVCYPTPTGYTNHDLAPPVVVPAHYERLQPCTKEAIKKVVETLDVNYGTDAIVGIASVTPKQAREIYGYVRANEL